MIVFKTIRYKNFLSTGNIFTEIFLDKHNTTLIVGDNGSGKSTLLQLLLGIYLPQEGAVSFNGIPLKNLDKSALMNHVGNYISQDTLFDGTLLENITMGRKFLKQEDLFWSIEATGLRRFVDSLPDGLSTRLVGGGARISESTAHKIIMARNLAERPSLFVVDDFLLGVEQSTKQDILRLLTDKKNHWTVFMASNDPMVMQASDRIVMMENGKIKSIDTAERLKEQGMFKNSDQSENN